LKKGQTKRVWTPEQKAEIVHKHLDEHVSVRTLEKQYNADRSMVCHWVKKYIAEGESSFIHKGHPGNKFAASSLPDPTRVRNHRNTKRKISCCISV
jgi:transposase-like protein